jgi:polar amino acid transport system substrate-binding protein
MSANAPSSRRRCLRWIGAAAAAVVCGAPRLASATPLQRVRERGALAVGLYNDMPPFHAAGAGVDVELARALADALGVRLTLLPFNADDNMNDDLRNMVWRGHYLGYGPADMLLHVPVDRPLMEHNPRVRIFAPYFRERVMIARRLERVPQLDRLAQLGEQPVAVAGQSLAGWLMLGADEGAYRRQLDTQHKQGAQAAQALARGEAAAAVGLASELESVLRGDARFAITPLPVPRAPRDGWAVGMAVKRDASELSEALAQSVSELAASGRLQQIFERANVSWRAG